MNFSFCVNRSFLEKDGLMAVIDKSFLLVLEYMFHFIGIYELEESYMLDASCTGPNCIVLFGNEQCVSFLYLWYCICTA